MREKRKQLFCGSKKIIYCALFLIAFLIVFSSTYNPFNFKQMYGDSAVYITIAQGITKGQVPYRDFVDNKGPLTYLISAPGLFLGGFTGVWITELIVIFISVLFAYKTALFFADRRNAFLATFFCCLVLLSFFYVNAGTEEYSLPFLMISFFIFSKYYFSEKEIRFYELVILGACFACAIMTRLNAFPLWAGFCVAILVETLYKRKYSALFRYISGFCLGVFVILLPVFLYLKVNDILNDFYVQVIAGGTARGFSAPGIKEISNYYFEVMSRTYSFLPLFMGLYWIITKFKQPAIFYYFGFTLSFFSMVLLLSFSWGNSHYNLMLIPFFVPSFAFLTNILKKAFGSIKWSNIILASLLCIMLSEGIARYVYNIIKLPNSGRQLINAGKMIDENTKPGDKIFSVETSYIYPFTQRDAVSRYIYQGSGIEPIPGSREEFLSDILTNKPAIIAVRDNEETNSRFLSDYYAPVYNLVARDYRLLSGENGFRLFIRKDNM